MVFLSISPGRPDADGWDDGQASSVFTDRSVLDGDCQVLAVAVVGVDFRAECAYPGTVMWLSTGDVVTLQPHHKVKPVARR